MSLKICLIVAASFSLVSCMTISNWENKITDWGTTITSWGATITTWGAKIANWGKTTIANWGSTISNWGANIRDDGEYLVQKVEEGYKEIKTEVQINGGSCSCKDYTCRCCVQLVVEKISLNETGCVSLSYLPDEYGFEFKFTLNNNVIIDDKISVKNPLPVCATIPYVQLTSLCIRFYNLDYQVKQSSDCADIEVQLEGIVIGKFDLGCIHNPPSQRSILKP